MLPPVWVHVFIYSTQVHTVDVWIRTSKNQMSVCPYCLQNIIDDRFMNKITICTVNVPNPNTIRISDIRLVVKQFNFRTCPKSEWNCLVFKVHFFIIKPVPNWFKPVFNRFSSVSDFSGKPNNFKPNVRISDIHCTVNVRNPNVRISNNAEIRTIDRSV